MINKEDITFEFYNRATGLFFYWTLGKVCYQASVNSLVTTDRVLYNNYSRKWNVWCYEFCPVAIKRPHHFSKERILTTRRRKQRYIFKVTVYLFLPSDSSFGDLFLNIFVIRTVKDNSITPLKDYVLGLQD